MQRNGKRDFISLETSDFPTAIIRAGEMRAHPGLQPGSALETEIDRFLAYKKRQNEFTRFSSESKGYILKAFAKWIGEGAFAGGVTIADIERYYAHVREDRTISTANTYVLALRSFFRWAVEVEKLARRNPCHGFKLVENDGSARKDFCSVELRDRLIRECPREDLKFVLYSGFHAGLRKIEIIEARPFWFDLEAGLLHLRKTPTIRFKDREERTVPLTQEFKAFLQEYGLREPFMLAPNVQHGKSKYRYDFLRPFKTYMEEQGTPWVTPHIMRHTFASLLASHGKSIYKIAKWLGDDVRVADKVYAKLLPNDSDIEIGTVTVEIRRGKAGRSTGQASSRRKASSASRGRRARSIPPSPLVEADAAPRHKLRHPQIAASAA
jgi:integrase